MIKVTAAAVITGAFLSLTLVAVFLERISFPECTNRMDGLGLTEDDFVALLPHLRNERLTRVHRPSKSDLDIQIRSVGL